MSTLQIILLSIAGVFSIASIVFMVMFILEISIASKEETNEEAEVKSIFSSELYAKEAEKEDVNTMLAKLDEQAVVVQVNVNTASDASKEEAKVEAVEEPKEEVKEEVVEEEVKEEPKQEEVVETEEETKTETVVEEVKVEAVEQVSEAKEEVEEVAATEPEEAKEETTETAEEVATPAEENHIDVSNLDTEMISIDNLPDYKARLESIIESRDKINKDLIKVEKSILNYERTKRRKTRNQKMLDRRASELTNLNLVMYSVTDIKNVDEEKKIKQEELTSHIAELKASIQDADEFLDSNKEKNDHDVKMAKYLIQEKARYSEEIAELEKLIAKIEGTAA